MLKYDLEVKISCPVNQINKVQDLEISKRRTMNLLEEDEESLHDLENVEKIIERKLEKSRTSIGQTSEFILKVEASLNRLNSDEISNMVIELLHERMNYKEKLRIAKGAIVNRDLKIKNLKSQSKVLPMSMNESKVHLAFLFSSPLVRKANSKLENIMQLDYLTEISDIVKVWGDIGYEMKYKTAVATVSNLRSTITDCPIALHFSGHGIENTAENLGIDYFLTKNKGNILLLEDERGMSDYFFEEDLKYMIEMSQNSFEVVFVSSWYSQFAGEVFLNAGAKHVICIRSGEQIADVASLRFSKVFYETLFVKNYNVCTSFKIAKEEVSKVINASEACKFLLLIQPDAKTGSIEKHICYSLTDFKEGKLSSMDKIPIFDSIPSNVEGFIGRQQEMFEIIDLLEESRLVSILGPPGIGKTSISRNLGNYLRDRKKFTDGFIYVALRGCETAHMFLARLTVILQYSCSSEDYQRFGLNKRDSEIEEAAVNIEQDLKYRGFIINMLKEREVLIILDNTEDPLEYDNARFISELNSILENCRKVKFLVTSRKSISRLSHNAEAPYTLYPLSKEESLKLLICKSPRKIKEQELHELLKCKVPRGWIIAQMMRIKNKGDSNGLLTLLDHPFTEMLGGHPQAISLAAPLLEYKSLKEIFQNFWDSNVMDALEVSNSKNASTSLRVSLELSIKNIEKANPNSLNLFSFIGLFPGGIEDDELTHIWGGPQWITLKDALIRASLLVYKTDSKGHFIYSMLPFMSIRAYELLELDKSLRDEYHMKTCRLFKHNCQRFFKIKKPSVSQIGKFTDMESNIWACIYRGWNKKRDIIYEGDNKFCFDSESDEEDYKDTVEEYKESIQNILKKEIKPRKSVNPELKSNSQFASSKIYQIIW